MKDLGKAKVRAQHDICLRLTDSRGTAWEIPRKTTDPQRAQHNLLERDRLFTDRLFKETKCLALPIIEVDIAMTEDELTRRVTQAFGL